MITWFHPETEHQTREEIKSGKKKNSGHPKP